MTSMNYFDRLGTLKGKKELTSTESPRHLTPYAGEQSNSTQRLAWTFGRALYLVNRVLSTCMCECNRVQTMIETRIHIAETYTKTGAIPEPLWEVNDHSTHVKTEE